MLGICAGNKDETDLGNIVVADSSFNYQAGKIVDNEFFADGGELQLDGYLQNLITTTKDNFSHDISKECDPKGDYTFPKLVIGQMISGSAVIKQENFFNTLKHKSRKITALDMEAYSVFVAANMTNCNKTKALVIKGVQDFADLQKNDKYRQHALLVCAKYFYKLCDYKLISKIKADS
jgi:nucleoside phosphorylase